MKEHVKKLVERANNKNNWKERLAALNEIRTIDCQQRIDVIIRLAIHDRVYDVAYPAFLAAQELKLTKDGKPIYLKKKDTGYRLKDFTKTFGRIKRDNSMDELDLERFKDHFLKFYPEMYDVMTWDKGTKFDNWIMTTYSHLQKKK